VLAPPWPAKAAILRCPALATQASPSFCATAVCGGGWAERRGGDAGGVWRRCECHGHGRLHPVAAGETISRLIESNSVPPPDISEITSHMVLLFFGSKAGVLPRCQIRPSQQAFSCAAKHELRYHEREVHPVPVRPCSASHESCCSVCKCAAESSLRPGRSACHTWSKPRAARLPASHRHCLAAYGNCVQAVVGSNCQMVEDLLGAGADPNACDNDGYTLLHAAVVQGNHQVRWCVGPWLRLALTRAACAAAAAACRAQATFPFLIGDVVNLKRSGHTVVHSLAALPNNNSYK
jgi:hypothetical protein